MRLHQRMHAPDESGRYASEYAAIPLHSRHGAIRARYAAKGRYHGDRSRNVYPLSKAVPDKTIVPASREAVCAFMKQNTLRKVYLSLRDGVHEITVDAKLAERARLPIERMLAIV
jgi:quinolinate synthetase A protein